MNQLLAAVLLVVAATSQTGAHPNRVVHLSVTGESNLKTTFIETFAAAGRPIGLSAEIVAKSDPQRDYAVIIAQESTVGSAAAVVIALDRDGDVAASVVRSGRLSGRGAVEACAKELAKKLAVLRP